jgi:hypothetical protein
MHGNINGGGGKRQAMSSVDFYRRVPKDLTEVSQCYVLCLLYTLNDVLLLVRQLDPIVFHPIALHFTHTLYLTPLFTL